MRNHFSPISVYFANNAVIGLFFAAQFCMVGCACTAYNVDCKRGPIVKMTDKSYRVIFEGKLTPHTPILITKTSLHPGCENKAVHHTTLIYFT